MYTPKKYKQEDKSELLRFIEAFPFGVLCISNKNRPIATHLPLLLEEKNGKTFLYSHMAKANHQWQNFHEDKEVLAIFSGPHGYVSPKHYNKKQNVPTWNYIAVHVYGKHNILEKDEEKITVLEKTINKLEASYFEQWKSLDSAYKINMVKEIVAFEIEVTEMLGQFKLSQNKPADEIKRVKETFLKSEDGSEKEIGKWM